MRNAALRVQEAEGQTNAVAPTGMIDSTIAVLFAARTNVVCLRVPVLAALKCIHTPLYVLYAASIIRDGNLKMAIAVMDVLLRWAYIYPDSFLRAMFPRILGTGIVVFVAGLCFTGATGTVTSASVNCVVHEFLDDLAEKIPVSTANIRRALIVRNVNAVV